MSVDELFPRSSFHLKDSHMSAPGRALQWTSTAPPARAQTHVAKISVPGEPYDALASTTMTLADAKVLNMVFTLRRRQHTQALREIGRKRRECHRTSWHLASLESDTPDHDTHLPVCTRWNIGLVAKGSNVVSSLQRVLQRQCV